MTPPRIACALAVALALALAVTLATGCATEAPLDVASFADVVVDAPGDTGSGTGDAERAVNGVRGAGDAMGSLDVFSLGYVEGGDDRLVLRWSGRRVANGPGADFVVFENAFVAVTGGVFVDPVIVEVSRDGATFVPLPHDYRAPDERVYTADPAHWVGFAGLTPVRLHEEDNSVDPFDTELAGGDAFDLDSLPADGGEGDAIRADGFTFLRIVSAGARTNPDTTEPYPHASVANGPDIDGVYARAVEPE